jgi:uncharacterized protein YndB with AHSA1/START domain
MPTLVKQSVNLPAGPTDLYAMYLDSAAHAAFTAGGPATIAPVVGTEWSAFDGRIWGRVLALTPSRRIVQSWRSFEWQEPGLDAVLVLTFTATSAGTCVDLVQVGVPDRPVPVTPDAASLQGYLAEHLPAPVDAEAVAGELLGGREVIAAEIKAESADLVLTFEGKRRLELFNNSSGYEGWTLKGPDGRQVIGQGGGTPVTLGD